MSDSEMVEWAVEKVKLAGSASSMRDFGDKSLASGLFLIDLLAAVEPRCVDRKLVTPGVTGQTLLCKSAPVRQHWLAD